MTDHGVSDSDMPNFPWQTRPEVRALDALLSGTYKPEEALAGLRPVAEVLVALQAPADRREVARWAESLIAYREVAGMPRRPNRSRPRRPSRSRPRRPRLIAATVGARLAAAAGVVVVAVLGSGIAAAYTGSLPVALQKIAHVTIAAPGVRESRAASAPKGAGHPEGPSASGSAAYGLCNAYQHAEEHGNASQRAVAFRNLVDAAGGAGQVTAYCAEVQHHGAANPPGRRTDQTASPTHPTQGRKPTTSPANGNDGRSGNGNAHGKQS